MSPKPDGLVHFLTSATVEKGTRTVTVRCGKAMPKMRAHDPLWGATGWESKITCSDCSR